MSTKKNATISSFFSPSSNRGSKFERPNSATSIPAPSGLTPTIDRLNLQPNKAIAISAESQNVVSNFASSLINVSADEPEHTRPSTPPIDLPSPSRPISSRFKVVNGLNGTQASLNAINSLSFSLLKRKSPDDSDEDQDDIPIIRPNDQNSSERKRFKTLMNQENTQPEKAVKSGSYSWLTNPRDKQGRTSDHPDYNARTLLIPSSAFDKMTPGQRQYWEVKSDNFDMILFFKMGKFYELFDDDALIGHRELDLLLMKSDRPHAGFPEISFNKYAERLIQLGYRIARVEQTETPQEMKDRNSNTGSKSKVVNRELVSVLTKGTLVDSKLIGHAHASYLLAVCESPEQVSYGVAFCDTATGTFSFGQFEDDPSRTRLRTLFAFLSPEEIIIPSGSLSSVTKSIIASDIAQSVLKNSIRPGDEFWSTDTTIDNLKSYFPTETVPRIILESVVDHPLGISSLGAVAFYLRRVLLDNELLPIGSYSIYNPNDSDLHSTMALDGQTLANLEILVNNEGGIHGTLLEYVDHCVTPFGHRLCRDWVVRPLGRPCDINARLDAVDDLMRETDSRQSCRDLLRKLPDLGRLLSRIHSFACGRDSKAVMYGNVTGTRLTTFLDVLDGFRAITESLPDIFSSWSATASVRLAQLTTTVDRGGSFPDLQPHLDYFDQAFDQKLARSSGSIVPKSGVDPEFDDAESLIGSARKDLDTELKSIQREFRDGTIKFTDKNNERYQVEISEKTVSKLGGAPQHYEQASQKKGFVRYYTDPIRKLVRQLERAEEKRENSLANVMRLLFGQFSEHYHDWLNAVNILAELDCLCSFALCSSSLDGGVMCRPEFVERSSTDRSILELRAARHPSLTNRTTAAFIPNDTAISCAENPASFLLVTGPNMGGKSTLLRQTCICVILSQIGCYVPADVCKLTPVDRIFTRLGACDRILRGQSTFFVELEETSTILRHASAHSLVILDELGRGTSTFDGTAIAYAVAHHLAHEIQCRTLFSTHYHVLSDEFAADSNVAAYHMASQINESTNDVTFLYKFIKGVASQSFGMNVAKMAKLPKEVVGCAQEMSEKFDAAMRKAHGQLKSTTEDFSAEDLRQQIAKAVEERDMPRLRELHRMTTAAI